MDIQTGVSPTILSLALLLLPRDAINDPADPNNVESDMPLSMPGDTPMEQLEPPDTITFAMVMTGTLVSADSETVTVRRRGEVDAQIFVQPRTAFFLDGKPVTVDELPMGGEVQVTFDLRGVERLALEVRTAPPGVELEKQVAGPPPGKWRGG